MLNRCRLHIVTFMLFLNGFLDSSAFARERWRRDRRVVNSCTDWGRVVRLRCPDSVWCSIIHLWTSVTNTCNSCVNTEMSSSHRFECQSATDCCNVRNNRTSYDGRIDHSRLMRHAVVSSNSICRWSWEQFLFCLWSRCRILTSFMIINYYKLSLNQNWRY